LRKSKGQIGVFVLILLIAGALGVYFGYDFYLEKYYLTLYDAEMVRYLELPSFSSRETSADLELVGQCILKCSVVMEQVFFVLESTCRKRGYFFRQEKESIEIEITPKYKIKGKFLDSKLYLQWKPEIPLKLQKKAAKVVPLESINAVFASPPKKKK